MSKKARNIALVALTVVFIFGIVLILYPILASRYADSVRAEVKAEYDVVIQDADNSEITAEREAAIEYNKRLASGKIDLLDPKSSGYYECLNLLGNGVMGYISIPKISVDLPIYHSVSDDVLTVGTGHMPQTSLPVGGKNTHCVISAHTGNAGSPLFTDLPLLKVGDVFYVEVLGETLTYQILQTEAVPVPISTVLPEAVTAVQVIPGEDLVTLVTCTPYGVNTHRLLVTGTRVDMPLDDVVEVPTPTLPTVTDNNSADNNSIWGAEYKRSVIDSIIIVSIFSMLIIILILFIILLRKKATRKQKGNRKGGGKFEAR